MNCFSVNVFAYGLRFKKYVYGNREDYTDEKIKEIIEKYKKEIEEKLDSLGYVN